MNITDLRNAVNGIDFDREKQRQMILEIRAKKKPHRYIRVLRIAATVVVCILTVGALSVPVRAVVDSLVRERMDSLPEEEIAKVAEQIKNQSTEANSATREYTAGEKERRGKLYARYLNGLFPEGDLTMVDSEEEAAEHEFCFLTTTGVFYLPVNRELTDEEILQKIDFEKKQDYAVQEQNAERIAEREAKEKEQVKKVVASGGITEERAVETATEYLKQVFGLDGSGMELNHYYNDPDSAPAHVVGTYCVNWSDMGNYDYYYFWIDAEDGTLRSLTYSHDWKGREAARPAVSEAPGKIAGIKKQAQSFLEEKLEIRDSFQEVKSYYRVNVTDEKVSTLIDVLFVGNGGASYLVECTWTGEVSDFSVTTKEDYEERLQTEVQTSVDYYRTEEGREVKIEIVEN
ncbi:MAG: hypothetical protein K2N39_03835 [Lachnospiraceae bacterium]|nr:hypothetical protein [Lachnospiraceae bacterium]